MPKGIFDDAQLPAGSQLTLALDEGFVIANEIARSETRDMDVRDVRGANGSRCDRAALLQCRSARNAFMDSGM